MNIFQLLVSWETLEVSLDSLFFITREQPQSWFGNVLIIHASLI